MNILFIASDNDVASGAFLSMVRLCTILKYKYNHNVHVLFQEKGKVKNCWIWREFHIHFIRTYNWISRQKEFDTIKNKLNCICKSSLNTLATLKYQNLFKKLNIDIVHMNTSWTYLAAQVAARMNIPYVWHIREFLEEDQKCLYMESRERI